MKDISKAIVAFLVFGSIIGYGRTFLETIVAMEGEIRSTASLVSDLIAMSGLTGQQ